MDDTSENRVEVGVDQRFEEYVVAPFSVHQGWRITTSVDHIRNSWQLLVLDDNRACAVLSLRARIRNAHRNRLSDMTHLVERQRP